MRTLVYSERTARCHGSTVSARAARPGFSLVDVLVSIAVIGVLISLLVPSLGLVRQTAHQVVCRSNVRQIGLGIAMFADEHKDAVPPTVFVKNNTNTDRPAETITLRLDPPSISGGWDGLGRLYGGNYLPSGPVFYCPAHRGSIRYARFEGNWGDRQALILGNYQYRGGGPVAGSNLLSLFLTGITPATSALVADSIRNKPEFNHEVGANVLRADLSVTWYRDVNGRIGNTLPSGDDPLSTLGINQAWLNLDGDP